MAYLHRRSFLERLSLGTGALLLSPLVKRLVSEAQGATTSAPKRFIVVTFSNGLWLQDFQPPDLGPGLRTAGGDAGTNSLAMTSTFSLPMILSPLEPYKNRLVMFDGLVNQQGDGGHWTRYSLFSCVPNAPKGENGGPGGPTFDEYVARTLCKDTPLGAVHLGAVDKPAATLYRGMFATDKGRDVPVQASPVEAFKSVFAGVKPGSTGPNTDLLEKRLLLDYVKDDVKRVQTAFASTERAKLDEFLSSVEDVQNRIRSLEKVAAGGTCGVGSPPSMDKVEDRFAVQFDIAAAALACGLTNVATISYMEIGAVPMVERLTGVSTSLHELGHGREAGTFQKIMKIYTSYLVKFLDKLKAFPDSDGKSLLDNSLVLYMSDNGEAHHSRLYRVPGVLIGNAGGKLKLDGRFIRWPARRKTRSATPDGVAPNQRALGDLYTTLSHGLLPTPVTNWGADGLEKTGGPLTELLV